MQYVADPGDLLAKNIQISNLQIPLFIAWLHAKEQYFLRFVYFLQKLRFRHFLFLFLFFFRTTSSLHMLVISYEN